MPGAAAAAAASWQVGPAQVIIAQGYEGGHNIFWL
jgi:hypothetical protein